MSVVTFQSTETGSNESGYNPANTNVSRYSIDSNQGGLFRQDSLSIAGASAPDVFSYLDPSQSGSDGHLSAPSPAHLPFDSSSASAGGDSVLSFSPRPVDDGNWTRLGYEETGGLEQHARLSQQRALTQFRDQLKEILDERLAQLRESYTQGITIIPEPIRQSLFILSCAGWLFKMYARGWWKRSV